jgi:hypothetical protein
LEPGIDHGREVIVGGSVPSGGQPDPFYCRCAPVMRLRRRLSRPHPPQASERSRGAVIVCWSCNRISGDERRQPVIATPFSAPTRAAHNRHQDASCARRLKLCSRPPLGLPNTRRWEPLRAPQS